MVPVPSPTRLALPAGAMAAVVGLALVAPSLEARPGCPAEMANMKVGFCVDRWEASLEQLDAKGRTAGRHSPFQPVAGQRVRARSRAGLVPQAHVSQREAAAACAEAGKRLCTDSEWQRACRGPRPTRYPYGDEHRDGRCNDRGVSPLLSVFGPDAPELYGFEKMNDPRLNRVPGSLARTGAFKRCRSAYGVHDMVGNLHEWTADPAGTFRGGYYLDTVQHGEGCAYVTTGHDTTYRDYSIGFRCCRDVAPARPPKAREASPAPRRSKG